MLLVVTRWIGILLTFALWATPSLAEDRAASIELRRQGFAILAEEITKELAAEPQSMQVPNLRKLERGTTVDLLGMNASYRIERLFIAPTAHGLRVDLDIADFYLSVARIDVHRAFPVSCYGTSIRFGHYQPAPVHLTVDPVLVDEKVQLHIRSSAAYFGADYSTYGPSQCRGRLFNRPLIRSIVAGSIAQSRADFERSLVERLRPEIEQLASKINRRISDSMEFNLRHLDVIPDQDIRVRAFPTALEVDADKMRLELGIDVERFVDFKDAPVRHTVSHGAPSSKEIDASNLLGTLGVSASAMSEILAVLLSDGSRPLHATPDRFPRLAEILHVDIWQEIWPDLGRSDLSRPEMYPVLELTSAPVVSTDDETRTITTKLDQVKITLRVEKDGEWQDYFHLVTDLQVHFEPQIEDGEFRLFTAPGSTLVFSGEWADGDIARDRTARIGELNDFMADLLEGFSREPLIARQIQQIAFQGHMLTIGELAFVDPFVTLNWLENVTD